MKTPCCQLYWDSDISSAWKSPQSDELVLCCRMSRCCSCRECVKPELHLPVCRAGSALAINPGNVWPKVIKQCTGGLPLQIPALLTAVRNLLVQL